MLLLPVPLVIFLLENVVLFVVSKWSYHGNSECHMTTVVGCRDSDRQFVKIGDTFMNDCNTW